MISNEAYLQSVLDTQKSLGLKAIVSDATMVIRGQEDLQFLIKEFPWPVLSPQGSVDVPSPMGLEVSQPQQLKMNMAGPIVFIETKSAKVRGVIETLNQNGAFFEADVYEGTPDNYTDKKRLQMCFVALDNPSRDMEQRGGILLISGTLHYHYTGA